MTDFNLLRGKTVCLRALEPSDAELLYEWENDTAVWRVSNTLVPFSLYQIEEYILGAGHDIFTAKQVRLMIEPLEELPVPGPVGTIDLFDFDPLNLRAGLGILVRAHARGQGFASDALETVVKYAFSILRLNQIYCHISADNIQSIRLFEQAGFVRCGLKKQWLRSGQDWIDEYMYQLLKGDVQGR